MQKMSKYPSVMTTCQMFPPPYSSNEASTDLCVRTLSAHSLYGNTVH